MSKLERITITLTKEMAAKLKAAVDSGEYATTSEIVREALRDWDTEHEREEKMNARIRALIAEAEKEEDLDGEIVLKEFQDYVAQLVAAQKTDKAA